MKIAIVTIPPSRTSVNTVNRGGERRGENGHTEINLCAYDPPCPSVGEFDRSVYRSRELFVSANLTLERKKESLYRMKSNTVTNPIATSITTSLLVSAPLTGVFPLWPLLSEVNVDD